MRRPLGLTWRSKPVVQRVLEKTSLNIAIPPRNRMGLEPCASLGACDGQSILHQMSAQLSKRTQQQYLGQPFGAPHFSKRAPHLSKERLIMPLKCGIMRRVDRRAA